MAVAEAIEAYQTQRLNQLLASALAHSPWHADRLRAGGSGGCGQAGRVTLDDLPRLPTMNKRDARDNVDQLVWRGVPGGVFKYTTGGSSGEPLIFYFGRARQASDAAGRMRARRWWGVEPGEREAYLWGAPVELNKTDRIKTLRDRLVNQLVLNAFAMSPAAHGRLSRCAPGLAAQVPVRLCQSSSRCWRRMPRRAQRKLQLAAAARGLHHRRAAVSASARTHRTGLRRAGGERVRQPRHRLHRPRGAGRADAADERKPSSSKCWTRPASRWRPARRARP